MANYTTLLRILFKPIEFILLSVITIIVSPLIGLVWLLDIAEKLKQGNHKRPWVHKTRKGSYDNRNNPVIQG
jgi:hypothetical protein